MSDDIYVAKDSAVLFADGRQYVVHKGRTRVRADHPLLRRNGHLFKPLDVDFDVEDASAAPGEKRSVKLPDEADELDRLRAEATQMGVEVDGRWKADRLRKEIDAVKAKKA
jgi:hypothetical protein